MAQNGAGQIVIAEVGIEAELTVGFDGVGAVILQLVGAQLIEKANSPPFLKLVDQQPAAFGGDGSEGDFELGAAIAAQAVKDVAGEALRVDAHQGRRIGREIAHGESDRLFGTGAAASFQTAAGVAFKTVDAEETELSWEIGFGGLGEPDRGEFAHV